MPTYEYRCQECGVVFEVFHAMSADPPKNCEDVRGLGGRTVSSEDTPQDCSGIVERQVSGGTGLIFKGSGFYETDYKKNQKSETSSGSKTEEKSTEVKAEASTKSDKSESTSASETKVDSKTDTTKPAKPAKSE
jgi:putative FmdB family regulatory protein